MGKIVTRMASLHKTIETSVLDNVEWAKTLRNPAYNFSSKYTCEYM